MKDEPMDVNGEFRCLRCGARAPASMVVNSLGCDQCREAAPANFEYCSLRGADTVMAPGWLDATLWRYDRCLPLARSGAVSLGEGLTPLVPAPHIGEEIGVAKMFIKDEGRNPTWSHKDRFSTVLISVARSTGAKVVATASSGNAGASLAAYARRAKIDCVVASFGEHESLMLAQIRKYGATVFNFQKKAERWRFLQQAAAERDWIVTSPFQAPAVGSHPVGVEGYKTLAFEIVDQLGGQPPDWCALPVCYGDAIIGMWQGFRQLERAGKIDRLPRLIAAEVHGSLSAALECRSDMVPSMSADFEAKAVSIGAAQSTYQALKALRESDGVAVVIDNTPLLAVQDLLARTEGVFAELASVTPFEAVRRLTAQGVVTKDDTVVCVVTASGLKDIDKSVASRLPSAPLTCASDAWRLLPPHIA